MANPYLEGNEDDDILNATDNLNTGYGRKQFVVRDGANKEIAPELEGTVSRYVSAFGAETTVVGENLPVEFKAVSATFGYLAAWPSYKEEGPLMWAMAEILDEMSDGYLSRLYDLRESERKIIYTHSVKRFMNSLFQVLETYVNENNFIGESLLYIESFVEIVDFIHFRAVEEYEHICRQLDREPDASLIETGIYTTRNKFCSVAMARPVANGEE